MTNFDLQRVYAIGKKEVAHILRDPFTLIFALGIPFVLVSIFGLAVDFDVKDMPLAVRDEDQTSLSRNLKATLEYSGTFKPFYEYEKKDLSEIISNENARAIIIIKSGLQKNVSNGVSTPVQFLLDGADNTIASSLLSYMGGLESLVNRRITKETFTPMKLETRFLFNHQLESSKFIVPGLIVVVLSIVSILLTALTVAREWENGSMELLLTTPASPLEIIIGKLTPYVAIGIIAVIFIYLNARLIYDLPFHGGHFTFLIGCILFITAYLGQGLLISIICRKQVMAMQLAMTSGLLPSFLLSGFIFPIENMPTFFHYLTMIFPARWSMDITRSLFLKGTTFVDLINPFMGLIAINIVFIGMASLIFKKDLEP
jgi:ABC-2 type transport system permease protein